MVEVSELESSQGIPGLGEHSGFPAWLTLLQNHEHKTQEMLISFNSEADRFGWIEVIFPVISHVSYKSIFKSVSLYYHSIIIVQHMLKDYGKFFLSTRCQNMKYVDNVENLNIFQPFHTMCLQKVFL